MRICIVGTGYVGLVTGTCFASAGHEVTCVDIDYEKIDSLRRGKIPIYEPGLEALLTSAIEQGRIEFTTDLSAPAANSEIVFLAVGTPSRPDGFANLDFVLSAARQLGHGLRDYALVINKSTVPVGTTDRVREVISEVTDQPFDVVSNPEFLREGSAVEDFLNPDRVVVGADSDRPVQILSRLYEPFVSKDRLLIMDPRSAELSKYAANAMLASRISFMNEMANLSERVGADIGKVKKAIGLDRRIGDQFLDAGIGYGGSCFPKDVRALEYLAVSEGCEVPLLSAINRTNEIQKGVLTRKIVGYFGALGSESAAGEANGNGQGPEKPPLCGRTLAVWGLAFKAGTDDVRDSPALVIINDLVKLGARVRAFDPVAMAAARPCLSPSVVFGPGPYEILDGADALVVVTEWDVFRNPDLTLIKRLLRQPVIFDGRNLYDPARLAQEGLIHFGIGRRPGHKVLRSGKYAPADRTRGSSTWALPDLT